MSSTHDDRDDLFDRDDFDGPDDGALAADEAAPTGRRRSRRRKGLCCGLSAVLILALVAAAVVGGYFFSLNDKYQKNVDFVTLDKKDREAQGKGTNILLLGSDKRSGEEAKTVTGQRSDVMMLVHIDADNKHAYVLSFPRDLYIDIPGHGKDRINSALAYGGVPLATQTVEKYVGTKIDHVALVDFDGIKKIVDTLGGVDVKVSRSFEGDGIQFTQGTQHMDGETALTFVRQRKQLPGGDFDRNANQRALLSALVGKILSGDTLSDPNKIQQLAGDITPYMTVDDGLTGTKVAQLGLANRGLRSEDITYGSMPHGDPTTTSGGASVVATDDAGMEKFRTALKEDRLDEWAKENL
ncbi:LCP family protein [Helcobacillus massiliensis]|uniref:LCP family protein required for cell wall assembly n=1 Tax=Helcobacillus massiliensis TaxID=521392 RepID=A0A839R0U8_9MICO|nr:LCP family protein [Helcobacillus massiliensis]MBB3023427.1 LCP family protein required for cell wall assembly [Helcobacillus massiliensis]